MYLISIYFDKNTENRMQSYIDDVAKHSGNTFMIDNDVPPHITISAFETLHIEDCVSVLNDVLTKCRRNKIEWVTVGTFPTVIFIQPVLNEYLHHLSNVAYESMIKIPDTKVSKFYRPFNWLPHATIAKQLSEDEMRAAFDVLQKSFSMFEGEVARIELAKKHPFRILASWNLDDKNDSKE